MIPIPPASLIRLFIACLVLAGLASCSGSVSGPAPVNDPTRITILPETATLYSGVPTTFVISGGTGSYIVTSSNQAIVPISGNISGNSLVITPNAVGSDTNVTLTVRDTGTTPTATATLTVRPGTVSNEVTITPTSTQGLSCSPAICSGGDAAVSVTLSQAGAPLVGRSVRFDAVTGDYRFITSTSGSTIEVLETSTTVSTDQFGRASARIRALPGAANQTALLQATDTTSGAFQRTSFAIAQATGTSPGFFATPSSITFSGTQQNECAGTNISAIFYVFGGTPPYVVSNTLSTLIVRPDVVTSNGGGFTVTPTGACIGAPGVPITIRDAAGRTTSVSVSNVPGTQALPALSASPNAVSLSSCDAAANIQVAGGRGTYFVASGSDALIATISGSTVTVRRRNPSVAAPGTGTIGISDGTSVVNVTVTLTGQALGACPPAGFTASPTQVTLSDCATASQVVLSGGTGTYSAASSSGSIASTVSGNVVSIRRVVPSPATAGGTVTVSDGASTIPITVSTSGAGAGACGGGTGGSVTANPSSITLTSCTVAQNIQLAGGSGTYTAAPNNSNITTSVSGSVLSVRRTNPSSGFGGGTITVSDGSSSTVVTVAASGEGAGPCPTPIMTSPSSVTLSNCSDAAVVTISGGSGNYSATASSPSLTATVNGNVLSIRRTNPSGAFNGGSVTVSDGSTTSTISVNAVGTATGSCPTTSPSFAASRTNVQLTDCSEVQTVTLSGGSGSYSAASQSSSLSATVSGSTVSIRRAVPSGSFTSGSVIVSDGSNNITINVTGVGQGAGACSSSSTFAASPDNVTLNDCTSTPNVVLSGGSGTYQAAASSAGLVLTTSGNILTIARRRPSEPISSPQTVTVSDGSSSLQIGVTLASAAQGACPP